MPTPVDLAVIRKALVRELETINHYQELHDQASEPGVRALMLHLMDEEKEHVAELTAMLRAHDPVQDRTFREEHSAAIAEGNLAALAHKPGTAAATTPAHAPTWTGGLTVGSLMGQPI